MRRILLAVPLTVAMLVLMAAPAMAATPANGGMGKMYSEHIRMEAKAGMLGPDVHPGMHRGMAGWEMPMP